MVGLSAGTAMTAADAARPTSHPPTSNPPNTIPRARSRERPMDGTLRMTPPPAARRLADRRHPHEGLYANQPLRQPPKFDSSNEVVASCIVQEPSERAHRCDNRGTAGERERQEQATGRHI